LPFRVADAVPTRGEGDWSVEGLADRVAAMGLVSRMRWDGFLGALFLSDGVDIVYKHMGHSRVPSETMWTSLSLGSRGRNSPPKM
jgi:hypothetical protein